MSDLYTRMITTAATLLDKYKQGTITYTPKTAAANNWSAGGLGTPVAVSAVVEGVKQQYVSELINASDLQLTVKPFGQTPTIDGIVTIDGSVKQIVSVQQIPAAGDPINWLIFVRG